MSSSISNYYQVIDRETRRICRDMTPYIPKLKNLNAKRLSSLLSTHFVCEEVMKAIGCIIRLILSISRSTSSKYINSLDKQIGEWFTNARELTEGAAGIVIGSGIKYEDNLIIIKTSKDSEDKGTFYEYLIGMTLNQLRSKTPCFVYTYGAFTCEEYTGDSLCDKKGDVWYIVTENIKGMTFHDMITNPKFNFDESNDIYLVLLQVFLSLEIALEELGFTHYDLHTNNILVRELPTLTNIKYVYRGKDYYILTKYVPVIIDFGLSRVSYPTKLGSHKGITIADPDADFKHLGIDASESRPGLDIYKFLLSILRVMKGDNVLEFNIYSVQKDFVYPLFGKMSEENFDRLVKNILREEKNYGYPFLKDKKESIPDDFVYYPPCEILEEIAYKRGENVNFSTEIYPDFPLFNCDLSYSQVLKEILG